MGTNAKTTFVDNGEIIANVYKRYDGFPQGWGVLQANFLSTAKPRHAKNELVEPFRFERKQNSEYFYHEGLSHLAPKMIAYFISIEKQNDISFVENNFAHKTNFYYEVISSDKWGKNLIINCYDFYKKKLFSGTPINFLKASHLLQDYA